MKTIALVLSVLSMLSVSVVAEDLADFISEGKTYTVCLSDGQVFYGVELQKAQSETNWAHISYTSKSRPTALQRSPVLRRRGTFSAWINLAQVTSIHEAESPDAASERPEDGTVLPLLDAEESAEDVLNTSEESEESAKEVDAEGDDVLEKAEESTLSVDDQGSGLEGAAVGGLIGGEAGAAIGFIQMPDHLIQGAWEFVLNDGTRAIKIIGDGRWDLTHFDRDSGEVKVNHGGRYTFDGKRYVEHVEYANESTANLVGEKHTFELIIEGDVIHQKGVENPWTEDWTRVKR